MSAADLNDHADPEIRSPRSLLAMLRTGVTQKQLAYVPLGVYAQQHPGDALAAEALYSQNQALRRQCIELVQRERERVVRDGIYEEEQIMFPDLPRGLVRRAVQLEGFLRRAGSDRAPAARAVEKKDPAVWAGKREARDALLRARHADIASKCGEAYERTEGRIRRRAEEDRRRLEELRERHRCSAQRHLDARRRAAEEAAVPLDRVMGPVDAAYESHRRRLLQRREDLLQKGRGLADKQSQMLSRVSEAREGRRQEQLRGLAARGQRLHDAEQRLRAARDEQMLQRRERLGAHMQRTLRQAQELRQQRDEQTAEKMRHRWAEEESNVERCRSNLRQLIEEKKELNKTRISAVLDQNQAILNQTQQETMERDQRLKEKQELAV